MSEYIPIIDCLLQIERLIEIHGIDTIWRSPNFKCKRELLKGCLFGIGLNYIFGHQYYIQYVDSIDVDFKLAEIKKEDLLQTGLDNGRLILKPVKKITTYPIQLVDFTVRSLNPEKDIYKQFVDFLKEKKLDKKAGDYKGTMLLVYVLIDYQGMKLDILRQKMISVKQDNFEQIWLMGPSTPSLSKHSIVDIYPGKYDIYEFNTPTLRVY